jgi:hypothetical protein
MKVSAQLHAPLPYPLERFLVPIEYEACWATEPVWVFWRIDLLIQHMQILNGITCLFSYYYKINYEYDHLWFL